MGYVKNQLKKLLNIYPKWINKREFVNQKFIRINERAIEYSFVFRKLYEICPNTILDVGTGTTALPHLMRNCGFTVSAADNIIDYWPAGTFNRHYYIINDDITQSKINDKFDLITCISVLEHIEESNQAIMNLFNLLNPKGNLIITFPYSENKYIQNVYTLNGSTYGQDNLFITQSYSRKELDKWLEENKAEIIEQEFWDFWTGDYWTIGNQITPPQKVTSKEKHQLSCIHLKKK